VATVEKMRTGLASSEEIEQLLPFLTPEERAELDRLLDDGLVWHPLPGPQTQAYYCEADETYYGGGAGGGKTSLLIGLSVTAHQRSIIFRREFPQLRGILSECETLLAGRGRFNSQANLWRLDDGRRLEFGAVQYEGDVQKYQGRAHDFKGFDELPQFTERQYRFLIGWNRTVMAGQRCRVVGAGNPPTNTEGEWVIRRWAPWLDGQHPNPARPGELRYFAVIDGIDTEVEGPTPFEHKGEVITPKSRTFIPAGVKDNPYLMQSGYMAVLQAMPEPLRSQMLYGDFSVGVADDPWQVIPTEWVRAAQARWKDDARPKDTKGRALPMTALGVDVARGGGDKTVLARRFGTWFAPLEKHPGASTPDGPTVAALVAKALSDGGYANIDGIGVGASVYDHCRQQPGIRERVRSIIYSEAATERDRSKTLSFRNLRAYAYWSFREALDPKTGDSLALPPDPELLADLCAPKWSMSLSGVQVEAKEDIIKRIGRSPDSGDAVVLAALIRKRGVFVG
jgi:hypothetical protein